jgi:hypothetical protein
MIGLDRRHGPRTAIIQRLQFNELWQENKSAVLVNEPCLFRADREAVCLQRRCRNRDRVELFGPAAVASCKRDLSLHADAGI